MQVGGERRGEAERVVGVAEDAVGHAVANRVEDHLGRGKIHVGHPHGQDVAAGPAVPLLGAGAAAIGAGGERGIGGGMVGHGRESLRTLNAPSGKSRLTTFVVKRIVSSDDTCRREVGKAPDAWQGVKHGAKDGGDSGG